ncbi:MAG: zinc-dependent metalloprotease [Brumimicrobium sp.]
MKKIYFTICIAFLVANVFGQTQINRCGYDHYIRQMNEKYPGFKKAVNQSFDYAQNNKPKSSGEIHTIPVVVHVVYNDETQNLHDSVIHNQIAVLNRDFQRLNADSIDLRPEFEPYAGRANIEFKLATVAPDGSFTNGINRVYTDKTHFLELIFGMLPNTESIEDVKYTNRGGVDPWDVDHYMNIWVCNLEDENESPSVLGMATPPAGLPNWPADATPGMIDGVVIHYRSFGGNNPHPLVMGGQTFEVLGRTAVHEVGHYLGLRHIWGDADMSGLNPSCNGDDGIADTPNANTQASFVCNKTKNTCVDDIDGVDLPDMVENYMDYSNEPCQVAFTKGQVEHMVSTLVNFRPGLLEDEVLSIQKDVVNEFVLYPNPANNIVVLKSKQFLNNTISIVDLNGRTVKEVVANGYKTTIDIKDLSNGIYQVITEGIVGSTKLVKY